MIAVAILNVAPIGTCPTGGITVQSGIDTNGNTILEISEATSTQYVCNGNNGANALNVQVLISNEPTGSHCANGGSLVNVGLDVNNNSILDNSETTSSNYICSGVAGANGSNGANGYNALVAIHASPPDSNCLLGGSKATSGLDSNRNSTLDLSEISSTSYVCTGATGPKGDTGDTGGGLSAYAYIYNLREQTVEVYTDEKFEKTAVLFDSNGVLYGIQHDADSDQITIISKGFYFVSFSISGTEPNQFALFVNARPATGSVYGSGAGTQQTYGQVVLELNENDVLRLVNYSSAAAVGLASSVGGTQANVNASIVIQKLN